MKKSGVLCHFSSLPSKFGIGDFGPAAYHWLDVLASAQQCFWQVLPIGHPDDTGCPYATDSAFGISEIYISPEQLMVDFDLPSDFFQEWTFHSESQRVNFLDVKRQKQNLLKKFFNTFEPDRDYFSFLEEEKHWLTSYCLFRTLSEHRGGSWQSWPKLDHALSLLSSEEQRTFQFFQMVQYLASQQLLKLKKYADSKKINIVGDVPIFVSYQSMDVWARPQEFVLDPLDLNLILETGAAPDAFSEEGQKWGTPIYNWEKQKENNFQWWQDRFQFLKKYFQTLRIDHFRGFCATWVSEVQEPDAKNGKWFPGPGKELFLNLKNLPDIIAEDLGVITADVEVLRDHFQFPGMRVLQFMLGDQKNPHKIQNYIANTIAYSGTHDCNTLKGWIDSLSSNEIHFVQSELSMSGLDVWHLLEKLMESESQVVLIQVQDLLELGQEARFNYPGTVNEKNWTWKLTTQSLKQIPWTRLQELTQKTQRNVCG